MLFYDIYLECAASSIVDRQADTLLLCNLVKISPYCCPGRTVTLRASKHVCSDLSSHSASCQGKVCSCFWPRRNATQLRVYHILKGLLCLSSLVVVLSPLFMPYVSCGRNLARNSITSLLLQKKTKLKRVGWISRILEHSVQT